MWEDGQKLPNNFGSFILFFSYTVGFYRINYLYVNNRYYIYKLHEYNKNIFFFSNAKIF